MNKQKLKKAISTSDKKTLIQLLNKAVEQLDANSLFDVFESFYQEVVVPEMTEEEIKKGLSDFRDKSLKGEYFDHNWEWTSKTYDTITPLTRNWYDEMGFWLDIMAEKALQKEDILAKWGFEVLFELIDELENETIIISHNSVGEENIFAKHDYRTLYEQLN